MKHILTIALQLTFFFSFGQDTTVNSAPVKYIPVETITSYKLGSTLVAVRTLQYGNTKEHVFINLHDNETTSVEAAKHILEEEGGLLIKIDNENKRLVDFVLNKRQYTFDPNRMFTKAGAAETLKRNKAYSSAALKKLLGFASFMLKRIPAHTYMLVAIHNNDEGNLAITSYAPGGIYATDAAELYINSEQDPDNFFLTTDRILFNALVAMRYNIILQENQKAKDDGSLSIYYGRKKRKYVNIEAELGKVDEQTDMIEALLLIIKTIKL